MTQEEKLEEAKRLYQTANADQKYVLESLFLELKESEEERIRQFLIHEVEETSDEIMSYRGMNKESVIAWLEKQGEQIDLVNKEYWRGYREGKQEILDKYSELEKQGSKKSIDNLTPQEAMDIAVAKCFEQGEQKPTIEMKSAEESLGVDSDTYTKIVDECVYGEQKPAWSEEDEKFFNTALWHISYSISNGKSTDIHCDTTEWFKALKDKYIWKPSDEQMRNFEYACNNSRKIDIQNVKVLKSLYNDLKKLKEE